MSRVKLIPVTGEHIETCVRRMRYSDVVEVTAMSGKTPYEELLESWSISDYSRTMIINDELACIYGMVKISESSSLIWCLGTDTISKYKRQFHVASKAIIDEMYKTSPNLYNYVDPENITVVNWLTRLGAEFGEPTPMGKQGQTFIPFMLRSTN